MVGTVGGTVQAKIGAKRGHAKEFENLGALPEDLRTGVLRSAGERPAIGTHTFSGGSIESLSFQAGIVLVISAAAYGVNTLLGELKMPWERRNATNAFRCGRPMSTLTHLHT
ncbi:hypothetical protein [Parasphingorhabdus pacifica]